MSNFDNLNKASLLMADSCKISTLVDRFDIHTSSSNIDKHRKGFNVDSRFKSFSANVYFSAYSGSYGDSSVSILLSIDSKEAVGKALIAYLDQNEEAVLKGVAEILAKNAKSLIDEAKKEVALASAKIAQIEAF